MSEYVFGFLVGAITMYLALKSQIKELTKLINITTDTNQIAKEIETILCKRK